jgi:hypothetical protein
MSLNNGAEHKLSISKDSENRVSSIIDKAVAEARKETQFDSFYQKTAEALKAEAENCVLTITRRILRGDYRQKEILLQILKYFKGVEHIGFLQDILSREIITARMGRIILDIFNKSDMMLEPGIASRLLDLDALSQKINYSVLSGSIDDSDIQTFISRPSTEQAGIMIELTEDTGPKCVIFLAQLFKASKATGHAMLKLAVSEPTTQSYQLLEQLYDKTGDKEIQRIAKKIAHALKHQGIDVAAAQQKRHQNAIFKTAELPEPRAFATMIDAEGFRLIFMLKSISQHEIKIFNIMLSEDKGIADIEAIASLRRESQQLIKNLYSDKKIEFTEIPAEKAAYLVMEALTLTEKRGILSPNMVQWKTLFSNLLPVASMPAIYEIFNPTDIQADGKLKDQSAVLLEVNEIPYWFIATDGGRDMWARLRQPADNELTVHDFQTEDNDNELVKETVNQFFTAERLQKFRRRLEELAYIFYIKGNLENAKIAFAQALDFATPGLEPSENLFCSSLIRKGIAYFKSYSARAAGSSPS